MSNKNLSILQRRSLRLGGFTVILTAALSAIVRNFFSDHHPIGSSAYVLAILPAVPFLCLLMLTSRYLAKERDEFVRMLVLQALFWDSPSLWPPVPSGASSATTAWLNPPLRCYTSTSSSSPPWSPSAFSVGDTGEEPPPNPPGRAQLEPGRPRRAPRGLPSIRQRHRNRQIRSQPSPGLPPRPPLQHQHRVDIYRRSLQRAKSTKPESTFLNMSAP